MTLLHRLASIVRWIAHRHRAERDLDDELRTFVEMAAADQLRDGATPAEARRSRGAPTGRRRTGQGTRPNGSPWRLARRGRARRPLRPATGPTQSRVLGDRDRDAGARHRRQRRDVQRRRRGPDSSAALCGRRPSRHGLGRLDADRWRIEVLLHAAPSGTRGGATTRCSPTSRRVSPATPCCRATVNPRNCRPARSRGNFWTVLGAHPLFGRVFTEDEDTRGARVVVISHGLWQRRFGGVADVRGPHDHAQRHPVRGGRRDAARVLFHARARHRHLDADIVPASMLRALGLARRALRRAAEAWRPAPAGQRRRWRH